VEGLVHGRRQGFESALNAERIRALHDVEQGGMKSADHLMGLIGPWRLSRSGGGARDQQHDRDDGGGDGHGY